MPTILKVTIRHSVLIAISAGFTAGALAMFFAWIRKVESVFTCEGSINWIYWIAIGGGWMIIAFMSALIISLVVFGIVNKMEKMTDTSS